MKGFFVKVKPIRIRGGLAGHMLRGGAGSVLVKSAGMVVSILVVVVLARVLGPTQFGVYTFVLAIVSLLAMPAQFGLPNLVVRETAKAHALKDWAAMKGMWRWANVFVLGSSLVLFVLMSAILTFGGGRVIGDSTLVVLMAMPLVLLWALGNVRGAALRGLRKVAYGLLPELLLRPLMLLTLVGIAWWLSGRPQTAQDAVLLNLAAAGIAFAVGAFVLLRVRPGELGGTVLPSYQRRSWLRSMFPLALIAGMHQVGQHVGTIVLGTVSTADSVGFFRVAMQAGMGVGFATSAVNLVCAPYFANLHAMNDMPRIRKIAAVSSSISVVFSASALIGFVIFSEQIVEFILGKQYSAAKLAIIVICSGHVISAFVASSVPLLTMTGNESSAARVFSISAIANVLLSTALGYLYGLNGVAAGVSVVLIGQSFGMWLVVRRTIGVDTSPLGFITGPGRSFR